MSLLEAVKQGDIAKIKELLSTKECPSSLFEHDNETNGNIFHIAIANQNPLVITRLIESLQNKEDKSWTSLLLEKKPELPLFMAAKLKDPQIFDLLIKQVVGYSLDDLEAIKQQRQAVFKSERRWGKLGAILKSACPSKSLVDALNIPDTLAGLGFIVGAGLLSLSAVPAAIVALVGLGIIGFSNYKKIIGEQNVLDKTLSNTILWAQINNFEKNLTKETSDYELALLYQELQQLKQKTPLISNVDFKGRTKDQDFLTPFDRLYAAFATLGDILCTNAGMAGLASLMVAAAGTSFALPLFILSGLLMMGVALFYIRNTPQHVKELVEQRRAQFDLEYKLYKSFRHFKHNIMNTFLSELELFETGSELEALKKQNKKALFDKLLEEIKATTSGDNYFREVVQQGHRQWFKYLIANDVPMPQINSPESGKTLLHTAVEKGHLLLVEEMLGVSIAAKNRKNKLKWPNPYHKETQNDKFEAFELLKAKRSRIILNYTNLHNQSKILLLMRDKANHLPLYYAAGLQNPSLYYMLLKQGAAYEKKDLIEAREQRLQQVNNERRLAKVHAIMEAICPGTSLSEIAFSISFFALLTGVSALGPVLAVGSIGIFGFVTVCNYFKGKNERGISPEFEILSTDIAYVNSTRIQLKSKTPKTQLAMLQNDLIKINNYHFNTPKPKTSDYTKSLIVGISLGTFLCSYAGTLGLMEIGASAFGLSVTGPIGLAFLIGGAIFGLGFALYYYFCQAPHEQRGFNERLQKDYFKQEALEEALKDAAIQELITKPLINPSPLAQLNQYQTSDCKNPELSHGVAVTDELVEKPSELTAKVSSHESLTPPRTP